jgi:hypothetical protein
VRVVAVAEHGNIDQVSRRRSLPNLGIDSGEVDPFVQPVSDPFVAGVGNVVDLVDVSGLIWRALAAPSSSP